MRMTKWKSVRVRCVQCIASTVMCSNKKFSCPFSFVVKLVMISGVQKSAQLTRSSKFNDGLGSGWNRLNGKAKSNGFVRKSADSRRTISCTHHEWSAILWWMLVVFWTLRLEVHRHPGIFDAWYMLLSRHQQTGLPTLGPSMPVQTFGQFNVSLVNYKMMIIGQSCRSRATSLASVKTPSAAGSRDTETAVSCSKTYVNWRWHHDWFVEDRPVVPKAS